MKRIKLFFAAGVLVVAAAAAFASNQASVGEYYYYNESIEDYVPITGWTDPCPTLGAGCTYQSFPAYQKTSDLPVVYEELEAEN